MKTIKMIRTFGNLLSGMEVEKDDSFADKLVAMKFAEYVEVKEFKDVSTKELKVKKRNTK